VEIVRLGPDWQSTAFRVNLKFPTQDAAHRFLESYLAMQRKRVEIARYGEVLEVAFPQGWSKREVDVELQLLEGLASEVESAGSGAEQS
jgi:hypothetical protein